MSDIVSQLGADFPMTVLPDSGTPLVVNGVVTTARSSAIRSDYPDTSITPTAAFTFEWRGAVLEFAAGVSVPVDADLLAALTAAGATFTQP